ncbi:1-phosphofructokinase [Ectobacillus ponti]|uniref:Tagatose-6-phosphate kinase n=1 Tax=Ectobacillus ponti TaxID=2961894 RepID=A0AA42BPV2_9BACI|nr:1-phosphofructokinase [Ectobacillus ponti]MCP8969580.1 1-phosphofructokinase [Ectobacillus ponti]
MIYTCTLNPSIDYIVEVDAFQVGAVNRATHTAKYPGGKGINVSRVLQRLGAESTALGFIGGFTGEFVKQELEKEEIRHSFIQATGDTRINVKLKSGEETEINGQGPIISEEQLKQLFAKINELQHADILVLAGSVPSSLPSSIYTSIVQAAQERGAKVAVDTSGPALQEIIAAKPNLVKPNHHELGELFGVDIQTADEAIEYGKKLVDMGIEYVLVSMAGDGALFISKNEVIFAKPPRGTVRNSVGAGDSMLAGFLAAYTQGQSLEQAFRFSVASGSATAFSTDLCTKQDVERLLPEVQIL